MVSREQVAGSRGADGGWRLLISLCAIAAVAILALAAAAVAQSSRGVVALVADGVFWLDALVLYFAPALAAHDVRHPGTRAILGVNAIVGWTLIGWIALLIFAFRPAAWSFVDPDGPVIPPVRKRCSYCQRQVGIEVQRCFHCGALQGNVRR